MAIIKSFKAVRPTRDKVNLVPTRSYEEYSSDEMEATLKSNPFSFLHIINPGHKQHKEVSRDQRFKTVRNRYLEFLKDKVLLKEDQESIYIYQIEKKQFKCSGFFCITSTQDYQSNVIKKHEDTLRHREELFAHYLETVKFNAEPVLMTFKDNAEITKIIADKKKKIPEYFFTTPDQVTHSLWVISDDIRIKKIQDEFEHINSLYIADGHHRSASSCLLAKNTKKNNPKRLDTESYNFFLSYLIPESEIQIYEFNRMVKDLNGLSKNEFLNKLEAYFKIEKKGDLEYKPTKKHQFSMYLDGAYYSLLLRKNEYLFTDELSELDTQILYKTVLEPILGITDLRTDKRIQYGHDKNNSLHMKANIDQGEFKVGFGLVPLNMVEIKAIADAGLVMPPKSTYIEPKLRSGLVIYEF